MPSPWKVNFIHSSPWLWHALLVPSLSHCHCICSWSYRLFSSLILCCFLLLNPLLSLLFFSTLAQFTCHFNYAWSSWFSVPFTREKKISQLWSCPILSLIHINTLVYYFWEKNPSVMHTGASPHPGTQCHLTLPWYLTDLDDSLNSLLFPSRLHQPCPGNLPLSHISSKV